MAVTTLQYDVDKVASPC